MNQLIQKAKCIIQSNVYMTIATSVIEEKQGYSKAMPWSTPVYYAFDEQYTLYWYSRKDTRHSQNIQINSSVAISIFDNNASEEEAGGVYIIGHASEVDTVDIAYALRVYFTRALPDNPGERRSLIDAHEDFLGDSPLRMYTITPEQLFISNDAEKWHGKWLDSRSEIQIAEITH